MDKNGQNAKKTIPVYNHFWQLNNNFNNWSNNSCPV